MDPNQCYGCNAGNYVVCDAYFDLVSINLDRVVVVRANNHIVSKLNPRADAAAVIGDLETALDSIAS